MSLRRQAAVAAAAGAVTWAVTAFATLVTILAVFFVVQTGRGAAEGVRTLLALLLLIIPLAVGSAAFVASLAWLCGRWGASPRASVLFAAVCCGASLYGFGQIVSAFNSCGLNISLPYPWFGPCD
jgi:hypothetical protein